MIRIGTVGTGFIVDTFFDAVSRIPEMEIVSVYSREAEKAKAFAEKHGVEKWSADRAGFLYDPELDFIYVASPNSLHYQQAKLALQHGKNVICEKPLVPYSAQARELVQLAKENGLFLFEGITTLYHPHFAWIKEHLTGDVEFEDADAEDAQCAADYVYVRKYEDRVTDIVIVKGAEDMKVR